MHSKVCTNNITFTNIQVCVWKDRAAQGWWEIDEEVQIL